MSLPRIGSSASPGLRLGMAAAFIALVTPGQANALDPVIDSVDGIYSVRLPIDSGPYVVWSGPDSAPPNPPTGDAQALHVWRTTTPSLITTPDNYKSPSFPLTGLKPGEMNSVSIAAFAANGTQLPWSAPVRFKPDPMLTALTPVMKYFDNAILRWADYDRDGDMDFFLTGRPFGGTNRPDRTFLYRNDGNGFAEVRLDIPCVFGPGDIQFGDYDNDGDLDLVIAGFRGDIDDAFTGLYMNENGTFVPSGQELKKAQSASMAWGDYDNDGDLDLLLNGHDDTTFALLYRNDSGKLVESGISLPSPGQRRVRMLDYDGDGRLDLALGTRILRNSGIGFTQLEDLGSMTYHADWIDYDKDGDWDALAGSDMFRNDSGIFESTPARSFAGAGAYWIDLDADDTLDVLTRMGFHRGTDTGFILLPAPFPLPSSDYNAFADFDSDGDPDLAISTTNFENDPFHSRILRNNSMERRPPQALGAKTTGSRSRTYKRAIPPPTGLTAAAAGDTVTLSWTPPEEAISSGLPVTYNLAMGTRSGGIDVITPMADPATGSRYLPAPGNAFRSTSWRLRNLPVGKYFWSVQVVDGYGNGGRFSAVDSFAIGGVVANRDRAIPSLPFRISPAGGRLEARFSLAAPSSVDITLFLPGGELAAKQEFPPLAPGSYRRTLDIRHLPQGLYLAVMKAQGGSRTSRFVVAP